MLRHLFVKLGAAVALMGLSFVSSAVHAEDTASPEIIKPRHAIAMHGEPALGPDFRQFPFVYEGALKGGSITVSPEAYGDDVTFDSLNPFIVKGTAYWAIRHLVFESLMTRNPDEPFTLYGRLAETVEMPEDRSWITFNLHPQAHFSNGAPVTPEDVIFTLETLRDEGLPNFRRYYSMVESTEVTGPRSVRLNISDKGDRETPLLLGLMPILSKAYYETHEFNKTTLEPPIGSGPYVITKVDAGRSVTFKRDPKYWGQNLAINVGRNNFDTIKLESYRDDNAKFEAFKKGLFSLRFESDPDRWVNGYDFNAVRNALIIRNDFTHHRPMGLYGYAFNTRKPLFADNRVRAALIKPFDFEWINTNFFYGAYSRSESFFDNSDLRAKGPASPDERALLAPWSAFVDPEIMEKGWSAPVNGNRENARDNARAAMALLKAAGWKIEDGKLVHSVTGEPFEFEILLADRSQERVALNYAASLKRLGIKADVRVVDSAQYQQRLQNFDFDMVPFRWAGSLSPGNEQAYRWGSQAADQPGSYNVAGVKNPAVDDIISKLVQARTREELVTAARALDRLLLSGSYAVPLYYQAKDDIAWWSEIRHPPRAPLLGWGYGGADFPLSTWWMTSDN